ncbi:uncharacterized protein LOC128550574 [Mercenaria mercenaria]|uniref:uncharacterized protein LOC128550574 n=1 Tax=Mercenaria mercenaria TaxID=6596 RepID=UPI00234F29C7|nr:uncharacterized protein LOC128550574 [Mercenaria mercenaria]
MASIKNVSITKGKTYTFRLYVLLYDIGGPVLRDLIRRLIYPDTLEARLTARHYYLLDLNTKKKLIDEYYHKLFPDGKAATSSDVFDLTLLIYLLRAVCDLRHSSDGVWSKMPANNDTTPEANITRLKLYRNAIFHEASTDVFSRDNGFTEEENFAAVWDTVKAAILDLDNGSSPGLRSKIDSLCKEAIDSSTEEEFRQEKERWRQQVHCKNKGSFVKYIFDLFDIYNYTGEIDKIHKTIESKTDKQINRK